MNKHRVLLALAIAITGLVMAGAVGILGCASTGAGTLHDGAPASIPVTGNQVWSSGAPASTASSTVSVQGGYVPAPVGNSSQMEGIWVTGTGRVEATPDVATLSLGVQAQAGTVADAQSMAADAMDKVMKALQSSGVGEKDINTTYFNISPVYEWNKDTNLNTIAAYQVTNTVTAKIRDLTKVGITIDAVAAAGGDLARVDGISFGVDDPTAYLDQARELALKAAMAKAQQMASVVGVTLGKPTYITESSGYISLPMVKLAEGADASYSTPTTPISVGEMNITVDVQIVFAIQ